MDRRTFIISALATVTAGSAIAAGKDYTPGLVKKHLDAGDVVFIDFAADWCTTCRAQERQIEALRKANPTYDQNIVFVRVDWDDYSKSALVKSLNIPRRSTLVVLKGNQELGRVVAQTSEAVIKRLMDTALAAA